jgi:hypothetical protein
MADAAARAEAHFSVLHMVPSLRERVVIAGMIPVHVGDDDILDGVRPNPERLEPFLDREHEFPVPPRTCGTVEAGVDHDGAPAADQDEAA